MLGALLFSAILAYPGLHTKPCPIGGVPATCGSLTVYEDRAAQRGRTIDLHFVLLHAKHRTGHVLAFNPGGPGASSTDSAPAVAAGQFFGEFTTLRDTYDVLLLDNRGTGLSAQQPCDFAPRARPAEYFRQVFPDAEVKKCRARLAVHANLSLYSTAVANDDLADVATALGYKKIVLDGGSYGTRMYLAFARQHPGRVESIVLRGVVPPHFVILPLQMAGGLQISLTNLIAHCKADQTCSAQFPDFGPHFAAVNARFAGGPLAVPVRNDATQQIQTVRLSHEVFVERIRQALYDPQTAAYIPIIIEHAYSGDYAPLARLVDEISQEFANTQANGLNLSVSCAEDLPFVTEAAIQSSSAGTIEGDARVRAQQRACRMWNVKPVPRSFIDPVRSRLPMLLISGTDDPASPAKYAEEALPYLPNARLLLIKGGSHESDSPCVDKTADRFVRARSAARLDLAGCGNSYKRAPFATTLREYQLGSAGDPALTQRFRGLVQQMMTGTIDRAQLDPAVSKEFSDAMLRQFAAATPVAQGHRVSVHFELRSRGVRRDVYGRPRRSHRSIRYLALASTCSTACSIGGDIEMMAGTCVP